MKTNSDSTNLGTSSRGRGLTLTPIREFLSRRPVLCLLLLAPEVEYLTGSTQLSTLIGSPPIFFIFLIQNLGSYGAAVLLIREAQVRWRKGWSSVYFLGAAYGIINEGIGADTLFYPHTGGAGGYATYGHSLGVNWVNVATLIPIVHPLYSVALPLFLFNLALPNTRGKSLLSSRGVAWAFGILAIDATMTSVFVDRLLNYFAGPILLGACLVVIAGLAVIARRIPAGFVTVRPSSPSASPLALAVVAAAFPWSILLGGAIVAHFGVPPVAVIAYILVVAGITLTWVLTRIGWRGNNSQRVGLAAGLVAGLIPMGIASQLSTGIGLFAVAGGDLLAVFFLRYLWRKYRSLPQDSALRTGDKPVSS